MTIPNDGECIVLDIGTIYCKAGLAGESKPRVVLSYNPTYLLTGDHKYDFSQYQKQNYQQLINYKLDGCSEKLKILIKRLLCEIFYRYLAVDPKNKRILFVENPFTSILFKQVLAETLFNTFKVSSISFLLSHVAGLFTFGRMTGLVVEIGYKETTVIPIYEGRPCLFYVEIVTIGGCYLDELVWRFMLGNDCHALNRNGDQTLFRNLDEEFGENRFIVEKIKCTYCSFEFGMLKCTSKCKGGCSEMAVLEYKDGLQISFPICAFHKQVTRLMGEPDSEGHSIAMAICDAAVKSPRDLRHLLCKNIVFVGGCASIKGFSDVLHAQMSSILENDSKFVTHRALVRQTKFSTNQFNPLHTIWIGGSLMGPHKLISEYTRHDFEMGEKIPDWSTQTCTMEQ